MDNQPPKKPVEPVKGAVDNLSGLQGEVEIIIRDAVTKKIDRVVRMKNLVVANNRVQFARLLGGDFLPTDDESSDPLETTRYISRVALGTGNAVESVDDVALTDPYEVAISTVDYPTTKSVRFIGILESGDGNYIAFSEAGLMYMAPAPFLATRKVFEPLTKSPLWTWEIRWTLFFA